MKRIITILMVMLVLFMAAAPAFTNAYAQPTPTPSSSPKSDPELMEPEIGEPLTDGESPEVSPTPSAGEDDAAAEPTPTPVPDAPVGDYPPYNEDPEHYRLFVDLTNCVVTAYERDEDGMYTKVVREMIISGGDAEHRTPAGTFSIGYMKERFGYFTAFNTYAQYWTQVVNGVYFHSTLYSRRDESTGQSASYNNLGRNNSHGCMRMYLEDARWIYYNIPAGSICQLSNRPRNPELTQRVKKTIPFNQYNPAPDPNPYPEPVYAYCNANNVPISDGFFGVNDKYIGSIDRGVRVQIMQQGKDYVKIQKENKSEGYTYARYFQEEEPGPIEIKSGERGVAHIRQKTTLYTEPHGPKAEYAARKNTDYDILEIKDDFFHIKLGEVEGWVSVSQADFRVWPETTRFMIIAKIRAEKLSMYPQPEKAGEAIDMLKFADEGRVFHYGPEWSLVRYKGQFGYVQSAYISVEFQEVPEQEAEQQDGVTPSEVEEGPDGPVNQGTEPPASPDNNAGDEPSPSAGGANPTPSPSASVSPSASPSVSPSPTPSPTPAPV